MIPIIDGVARSFSEFSSEKKKRITRTAIPIDGQTVYLHEKRGTYRLDVNGIDPETGKKFVSLKSTPLEKVFTTLYILALFVWVTGALGIAFNSAGIAFTTKMAYSSRSKAMKIFASTAVFLLIMIAEWFIASWLHILLHL